MNTIKLILCLMLSSIFSQGVFDQYDIPEYEYSTFQLNGNDLFFFQDAGDGSVTQINLGSDYKSMYQSPGYNLSYGLTFTFDSQSISYDDDDDGDDTDVSDWMMSLPFSTDKYFNDNKGVFAFVDGNLSMWGGDSYDEIDDTGDLPLTIGAGYGRIISAKPIAQAYAIADALGIDADDSTVLAIAAVIGSAGSYESTYKDDATQQYYNDLAEAAGVDGSAMQIQKVLTSPAYNVSDRFTGWDVRAGITNNYMQCDDCEDAGYMMMEANYAMPMDMDSQLMVSFGYTMDLNDAVDLSTWNSPIFSAASNALTIPEGESGDLSWTSNGGWSTMNLGATYTKDHSYNWSTSANFNYVSETFELGFVDGYELEDNTSFSNSAMIINVSTTKAILNQMSITGSFTYMTLDGDAFDDSDPFTEISTKITYWIF